MWVLGLFVMAVVWVAAAQPPRISRPTITESCNTFYNIGADENLQKRRIPLELQWDRLQAWLESRMERAGVIKAPTRFAFQGIEDEGIRGDGLQLLGLVRLTHRDTLWNAGPTTIWGQKAQVLIETYRHPTDAGAVKVVDAVQLAEPISIQRRQLGGKDPSNISSHRRRSDHTDILKHLFLKAHLFRPYHRALFNPSHIRVCDGRSVADVLSIWF